MISRKVLLWCWNIVRGCRLQAVMNIVIGLAMVATDFAFIFVSKRMIDVAVGAAEDESLTTFTILLIVLVVVQILLRVLRRWITSVLGVKAQNTIQETIFDMVLRGQWRGRERRHTGDVVNRLITDVTMIVSMAAEHLPYVIVLTVRLAGAFAFMFLLDARLAIAVIIILPLFLLISRLYFLPMRRLTREVRATDSRVQSLLQEMVQHQLVVKTLCQESEAVRRLIAVHKTLYDLVVRRTKLAVFSSALVGAGFSGAYLLAFIFGAYNLHDEIITYGTMIAFLQLVAQIQLPFRQLMQFVPTLINVSTAIERLRELCDAKTEESESEVAREIGDGALGIRFEDVSYQYSASQKWILQDLNFDFSPGTFNVVLGHTGVGKTTTIRLLLSLIKPDKGRVVVYDTHGNSISPSVVLRKRISYVPQGNSLLSGTIRDNLLFGNAHATEEEMRRALSTACAEFVYELTDGLDTVCGELGLGLSEGQSQRICIARSLLHGGNILLLDESTSAIDIETERRLLTNLTRMAKEKGSTIVLVTHREQVASFADNLLRL